MKKLFLTTLVIILTVFVLIPASAEEMSDRGKYALAVQYYNDGDYSSARLIFGSLGDYSNSENCFEECSRLLMTIEIADPYTADRIVKALAEQNIVVDTYLYVFQAEQLKKLDLSDLGLEDISFVSNFCNLETLNLDDNNIADIYPLKDLYGLVDLSLNNNKIEDVRPLYNLTKLETLSLQNNRVKNIQYLEKMTDLQRLDLSDNKVNDVSPLLGLKNLYALNLNRNSVSYLGTLAKMTQLKELRIASTGTLSIRALQTLTNLEVLEFDKLEWPARVDLGYFKNVRELTIGNRITDVDMMDGFENLEVLNYSEYGISDLSPLFRSENLKAFSSGSLSKKAIDQISHFTNLETLKLSNGKNLDCLDGLIQIKYLDLSNTEITDFSDITKLENLEYLIFRPANREGPPIDLSFIAQLKNLKHLELSGCAERTDYTFIKDMKQLEYLRISGCKNLDTQWFKDMDHLRYLNISGCKTASIDGLQNLTNLEYLDMSYIEKSNENGETVNNYAFSLFPLQNLQKLEYLDLGNFPLTDFGDLSGLKKLRVFFYDGDNVDDNDFFSELTNLEYLCLHGVELANLKNFANLKKLKYLQFFCPTQSLSGIEGLTNLEHLYLIRNGSDDREMAVTDLTPLANLVNLKNLKVYGAISDLSPLENLKELQYLEIDGANIEDISPLTALPDLYILNLQRNNISDISAVSEMLNLSEINLNDNPIHDLSPLKDLPNLWHVIFIDEDIVSNERDMDAFLSRNY